MVDCLEVTDVFKNYEGKPLLEGVSMEVHTGELLCLLGRSGSGKSTLLRIIAGIEKPDSGKVFWNGQDMADVPVHQRQFGLMFQDYALFPHLNVEENVAFGLKMQHLAQSEIRQRVNDALNQVNMAEFAQRRVTDLSGGEQQRVALARALAPHPRLLMLDEPLAALDRTLREQLGEELRTVLEKTGIPVIYVTHDQQEALTLSDRLALLHEGRIVQSGEAQQVFDHPATPWVAEFLGLSNLLEGEVISSSPLRIRTSAGVFSPADLQPLKAGQKGFLLLKPYGAVVISRVQGENQLNAVVRACIFQGSRYRVRVQLDSGQLLDFEMDKPLKMGQPVALEIPPSSVVWVKRES